MSLCASITKEYRDNIIKIIESKEFGNLYFSYKKCKKEKKYSELLNYIKEYLTCNNIDNIELYDCICNIVSHKYEKLIMKLLNSDKFYYLYKKYYKTCNDCELINYIDKKIECLNIDCSKCYLKPGKMKTVFLLQLSGGLITSTDIIFKNTINYYWDNYPQEFTRCPIVDTAGTLENYLLLLEKYYNDGYRYFVFNGTNTVSGLLEWFNNHPYAIGIAQSSAIYLNVPKKIYRTIPNNNFRISAIKEQINYSINNSGNIYFIYQDGLLICEEIKKIFEVIIPNNKFYSYPATNNNLTVNTLNTFLHNYPENSIIIIFLNISKSTYINLYSGDLTFLGNQYDINAPQLPIIPSGTISEKFNGKYNVLNFNGVNSSILWRNGYLALGQTNYDIIALNSLNLLNTFSNNESLNNINSDYGILQFNSVTKDLSYPSILLQQYNGSTFVSTQLFIVDPILGAYSAIFTNPAPKLTNILTPSYKPYGKAIALLELTNYSNNIDIIYQQSLYFYWYNNPDFKPFPIIDTRSSIPYTLKLLDKYYDEGYRIFLGFSRSSVLVSTLQWFDGHPDAIGISIWSTAIDLRIKKNIYRMEPSDNYIVDSITPELEKAKTVYYIYTDYELASLNVLNILQENKKINLKTYAIDKDNVNLTVSDLNNFFIDSNEDDVTLLYIFDEQSYFNLYNEKPPLTFHGSQYDIINSGTPKIYGTGKDTLNNKLYFIQSVSPNTSILWRENAAYLTEKYKTDTTSSGLCNALSMINYLLKGKSIELLGAYSGVLQFDLITKDILYPSYLKRVYNKNVDNFVKSSIIFDDPLLGKFEAQFII